MEPCAWTGCVVDAPPEQMIRVESVLDGTPLVAHACSVLHAEYIRRRWASGDTFVPELLTHVGEGRVAA